MTQDYPAISQIVVAPAPQVLTGSKGSVSIGIALDNGRVFWGDYLHTDVRADDGLDNVDSDQIATIERLIDLSASRLSGQRLSGFREMWERARPVFPPVGKVPVADGASAAIQQALLAAVVGSRHSSAVEILSDEYGLPPPGSDGPSCPLFLEISDFAATAGRIDRMLSMRPAGIGYRVTGGRVAEALGENAEYLQRFVRELGQRADQLAGNSGYLPSVYLGLNGALGQLALDPVRHIGKVLGNCVGLQEAAGPRRLILEDPILLDDPTAQPANLHRLKEFLRRTPTSLTRVEPTILAVRGSQLDAADIALYSDIQAVHAISLDFDGGGGIHDLMSGLAGLYHAATGSYLVSRGRLTPRWVETSIDIALAVRTMGLVFSFDDGDEPGYWHASRHLTETLTELNRKYK